MGDLPLNRLDAWRAAAQRDPVALAARWLEALHAWPLEARRAALAHTPGREELAAAMAHAVASVAPLAGIPFGIKDLFDVSGWPTSAGSTFLAMERGIPRATAAYVDNFLRQGAVAVAKTQLVEFAKGMEGTNAHFGPCHHPHKPALLCGGSSSGSAWMVAAGLAPFALGTDTAGSLRVPAACTGLWSWRRPPDFYARKGVVPLAPRFDTVGFLTADATTLRTLLASIPGFTQARTFPRLVYDPAFELPLDTTMRFLADEAACSLGADVLDVEAWPDLRARVANCYRVLADLDALAWHDRLLDTYRDAYDPMVYARLLAGRRVTEPQVREAETTLHELRIAFSALFRQYDAMILPVLPSLGFGEKDLGDELRGHLLTLNTPASLLGLPAISLPLFAPDGRSAGLQILFPRDRPLPLLPLLAKAEQLGEVVPPDAVKRGLVEA